MKDIISEENVNDTIYRILNEKFTDIESALDNYSALVNKTNAIQEEVIKYAQDETEATRKQLNDIINANSNWQDLDTASEDYTPEIDYYQKSEEYLYPADTTKEE